ncbi:hypothetical protein [Anaerorhabdus sp.]|uniref:hypothetical protein n=1 Tax=Anaerorhabdus sp. TaxID=1872524 RepID=UPI002FCC95EB
MRKLNIDDVLNAIALSEKFDMVKVMCSLNLEDKTNLERIGITATLALLRQATTEDMRVELYTFLSEPFEMEVEELRKMDFIELAKGVAKIASFKEWKELFISALDTKL